MADEPHDTIDKSYSFVNGISAALDGQDGNTTIFIVLFIGGGVLALIAILIGLVGLGLVPVVVIVAIRLANA